MQQNIYIALHKDIYSVALSALVYNDVKCHFERICKDCRQVHVKSLK